ncbi:hypothetical protein Hanom_Chr08g00743201 [Helianthus anomalus]
MKEKAGNEPVPRMPTVSTELVLRIFRFMKFSTGTEYYLFINDHGFHLNNIITIQLFLLIFFGYFLVFFLYFLFILASGPACNTLVVILKHM